MIQNLIYIPVCLLVLTKLADVITTLLRIQHHRHESNIIARTVMARLGIVPTLWIILYHLCIYYRAQSSTCTPE